MQERKCRVCGKHFIAYADYVYKRNTKNTLYYFCSWHCMREYDSDHKSRKGGRPNANAERICELIKDGKTNEEIHLALNVPETTVRYYRDCYIQAPFDLTDT